MLKDDASVTPITVVWRADEAPETIEIRRRQNCIAILKRPDPETEHEAAVLLIINNPEASLDCAEAELSEGEMICTPFTAYRLPELRSLCPTKEGWLLKAAQSYLWSGLPGDTPTIAPPIQSQTLIRNGDCCAVYWSNFRWWLESDEQQAQLPLGATDVQPLKNSFGAYWMVNGDIYYWSNGKTAVLPRLRYPPIRFETAVNGWLIVETSAGLHALKPGKHFHLESRHIDGWQTSAFQSKIWLNDGGAELSWDFASAAQMSTELDLGDVISTHLGQGLALLQGPDELAQNKCELWDLEHSRLLAIWICDQEW